MSRSKWKGPFMDKSILSTNNIKNFKTYSRASIIPKFLIGQTILIYNGKEFKKILINRERVGYKFGDFSPTRKNKIKLYGTKIKSSNIKK
jgi:small subunit ribosomal protein S19